MAFNGMDVVGTMSAKGTPCCFVCGPGETCSYASWNAYSPEISGVDFGWKELWKHQKFFPITFLMGRARELGQAIRKRLDDRR
jgi:hypothetical protein